MSSRSVHEILDPGALYHWVLVKGFCLSYHNWDL